MGVPFWASLRMTELLEEHEGRYSIDYFYSLNIFNLQYKYLIFLKLIFVHAERQ